MMSLGGKSKLRGGHKRQDGRDDCSVDHVGHGEFSFSVMRRGLSWCQPNVRWRFASAVRPTHWKWPAELQAPLNLRLENYIRFYASSLVTRRRLTFSPGINIVLAVIAALLFHRQNQCA
jgi:hypothetical protein